MERKICHDSATLSPDTFQRSLRAFKSTLKDFPIERLVKEARAIMGPVLRQRRARQEAMLARDELAEAMLVSRPPSW